MAIDNALAQKPVDLNELLKLLQESGYEVSRRGKSYRLKLPDWDKTTRLDSLGKGYTLEALLAVLTGQKEHTPHQKQIKQVDSTKISLLVDIQTKLQAGKGAGYARWAKVFNLKQMAQTMNYLTEHNLIDYASLKEKAATVTIQYNDLAEQIKLAEKRMAEIAVLKKHIINYAKTREIYVAYRKSGYSKKFMSEHESEILLHKAAKQAFDNLGMDKLPTISSLQDEYAQLMEEKKKIYPKFLSVRNQQRELLKVKHNIDVMMRITEKAEEAKEHDSKDHQH